MGTRILERGEQLRQIAAAAREAAAGHGSVLLVSGEAGIGKTSLVAATRAQLAPEGRLLVGHCDDLATARPLGPFRDLSGSVGVDLGTALTGATDRETLLKALWDELDWTGHGTVLAIEDVHWADHATLDVLRYLVRRIDQLPVVLMLTYRDDDVPRDHPLRALLASAAAGPRTRRLPLDRLSAAAVAELCDTAGVDRAGVYAVTAGNPYYVTEVLSAGSSDPVPATVVDAVLGRLRRLDPVSRAAVEQLSVVPAAADRRLVDALLPQGIASLAAAEERGLVSVTGHGVAFRHELTRRAVSDALPGAHRMALEACVLAALATRADVEPARLVHHAARAGDIDAVVRYAPVAAREAARSGAHREAVAHYRLALEHAVAYGAAERAALLEGSAVEVYTAGSRDRSAVDDQAAAVELRRRLDDRAALGASLRWLSRICWWCGDRAGAEAAAVEAVTVLESAGDRRLLAMAYSNQSQLDMLADRNDRAIEGSARAIALARSTGDAATLAHALCNHGTARFLRGDPDALESLTEARDVAVAAGEWDHATRAYVNILWSHIEARQIAEVERLLPAALEVAEENEQLVYHGYLLLIQGVAQLARGRFSDAVASVQPALRSTEPIRCAALTVLNRAAARTGRAEPALLDEMWQLAARLDELQRAWPAAAVVAEAAWLSGGDDALREPTVHGIVAGVHAQAHGLHRGAPAAELGYWLHRAGTAAPMAGSDHPHALQAAGRWREAAQAWEAAGYPYEQAAALAESPHADDAIAALGILDGLGAAPLAARIRRDLRARGVARVPRGPVRATRTHSAGLTPRQAEVADLLRQGLTNAEIAARLVISERTADHHVSAVLAKLGVRSRADLGTAAR
jgi:DNA-binding CsgD family transcriptional regulator/tetratricopeptide (TPR) repeat protein